MARIKGAALRGVLKYVKQTGGRVTIADVLADVPQPERAAFERTILTGDWYPYEAYTALLRVVDRRLGAGDLALMPPLGRYAARQDVSGIFKIISVLASIPRILQSASTFWERYHEDAGRLEITEIEDGAGTARITGFEGISREHTHVLAGWIEGIGLASGARRAEVTMTKSYHDGDDLVEYRMVWSR